MLAVAGMIGADARVPGMALMRAPLGQRGSLLPTGDQRAAGHRLDDLRAARHRDRRGGALRRALRLPRAVAVDARLRRVRTRPRAARADRLRPALHPPLRDLGGAARAPLPHLVGARRRRPRRALERRRARAGSASGRAQTSSSGSRSRGCRTPPTTRASRRRGAARSPAPGSATSCPTSGCSRSAPCSCSRATSATRPRSRPRSSREASPRSSRCSRCS